MDLSPFISYLKKGSSRSRFSLLTADLLIDQFKKKPEFAEDLKKVVAHMAKTAASIQLGGTGGGIPNHLLSSSLINRLLKAKIEEDQSKPIPKENNSPSNINNPSTLSSNSLGSTITANSNSNGRPNRKLLSAKGKKSNPKRESLDSGNNSGEDSSNDGEISGPNTNSDNNNSDKVQEGIDNNDNENTITTTTSSPARKGSTAKHLTPESKRRGTINSKNQANSNNAASSSTNVANNTKEANNRNARNVPQIISK